MVERSRFARRTGLAVVAPLLLAAFAPATRAWAGETARLHTPAQIADIGGKSKVAFATKIVDAPEDVPEVRHPAWPAEGAVDPVPYPKVAVAADGGRALVYFECAPEAMEMLEKAEPLFQGKHYGRAKAMYDAALLADPTCYLADLSAGDCRLLSGDAASAVSYYEKARAANPFDYRVHWFLGDALLAAHRFDEAREAYVQALVLSPRNAKVLKAVASHAAKLEIEVHDVPFRPSAAAKLEGQGVTIYTVNGAHWWIYGVCRGLWLADTSYRVEMTGSAAHDWTSTEDLECLGALLSSYETLRSGGKAADEPQLDSLLEVRDRGLLGAYVLYEFGSHLSPNFTLLLPDASRDAIAGYVRAFVMPKAKDPQKP